MIHQFLANSPRLHAALHAIVPVLVTAAPLLLQLLPSALANMTLSAAFLAGLHYLEQATA